MAELLVALTMTFVAWRFRRSFSPFLFGILLGMTWCPFLHGFCFGVLRSKVVTPKAIQED